MVTSEQLGRVYKMLAELDEIELALKAQEDEQAAARVEAIERNGAVTYPEDYGKSQFGVEEVVEDEITG